MQSNPVETTRITSVSDLGPHLDAWQLLAIDAPMQSPAWLLEWWQAYAKTGDELCVLLVHEPNRSLIGLAPLYFEHGQRKGRIRLLGSGQDCTHHSTWLSRSDREVEVGVAVGQYLLQHRAEWQRLLLESVDAGAIAIQSTLNVLGDSGCLVNRRPLPGTWTIALPATWDDYLRMLSRSLRKRCRKLQREFFDSGVVQIYQAESEDDLKKGFNILLALHATRWSSKQKPSGAFSDQRFLNFHEKVSKHFLKQNQLRLMWLESDGQPFAVEYQFFDSKTVYAYQAGADLSRNALSPGKLTMMAAIQRAIVQKCSSFDLLSGDEPYKSNWRAEPEARHDLRVWRDGFWTRLDWVAWEFFAWAVRHVKPKISPRFIKLVRRFIPRT